MKKLVLTLIYLLGLVSVAAAAPPTFDCSGGFSTTGECGLNLTWEYKGTPFKIAGADAVQPKLDGTALILYPTGLSHRVANLIYQTKVDVKSFTSKFVFIPNGLTLALNFNNATVPAGYIGADFTAGAGCEAGFFQGYGQGSLPNHVFAMDFDGFSGLEPYQTSPWDFTHSSVQIYQSNQPPSVYPNTSIQCPCTGGASVCGDNTDPSDGLHQITKLSTAPVSLNYPVNEADTTTGDTYSATTTYDGSSFSLDLANMTEGGPHYMHTWNTDIPNSVNGDTAWVGLVATSNGASKAPLYIDSWTYSTGGSAPTPVPTSTPTSQPTPPPTGNGSCTFTDPNGSVTWSCSPGAGLSSSQFGGPGILNRPTPAPSAAPGGDCQFTSPQGTVTWGCSPK